MSLTHKVLGLRSFLILSLGLTACGHMPFGGKKTAPSTGGATAESSGGAPSSSGGSASGSSSQLNAQFGTDARQNEGAIFLLYKIDEGKLNPQDLASWDDVVEKFNSLDGMAKDCAGKYAGVTSPESSNEKIQEICPLLLKRKELQAKALAITTKQEETWGVEHLESLVADKYKTGDLMGDDEVTVALDFDGYVAQAREQKAKEFATLGAQAPADLYASWLPLGPKVKTAFEASIKENRYKRFSKNPIDHKSIQSAARHIADLDGKNGQKNTVVAVLTETPSFEVETNAAGMPIQKKRSVVVVVQRTGEKFCRGYFRVFTAQATSPTDYAPYETAETPLVAERFLLTSCK